MPKTAKQLAVKIRSLKRQIARLEKQKKMKIIRVRLAVEMAVNGSVFEVVYKKRGYGNKHFRRDIRADDEISAYVKVMPLIEAEEAEGLEESLDLWADIKKRIPTADITRDVKKIKRLKKLVGN